MDKLSAFEYFKTIARTNSISAAADELGISQPALSAFLKRLEATVGTVLVDRSSVPMSLTDAGKTYLNYLEKADMLNSAMAAGR